MTEQRKSPRENDRTHLVEQYLGLESMEVTEDLLDLCGASIDSRALPLLKRRLQEEEAQIALLGPFPTFVLPGATEQYY